MAKLIKKWVNMFQMVVIFTLESKIGFINLGFGTYYDHCVEGLYLTLVLLLLLKYQWHWTEFEILGANFLVKKNIYGSEKSAGKKSAKKCCDIFSYTLEMRFYINFPNKCVGFICFMVPLYSIPIYTFQTNYY